MIVLSALKKMVQKPLLLVSKRRGFWIKVATAVQAEKRILVIVAGCEGTLKIA